jgi:hypothetical protein
MFIIVFFNLTHTVFVIIMWYKAIGAIFDPLVGHGVISSAIWDIVERTEAEQAIKVVPIICFMTGKIFASCILIKL